MVTLIHGDTGHLTYGRSQATFGSGNLHKLLERYCNNTGACFGERLKPSLTRFAILRKTSRSILAIDVCTLGCAIKSLDGTGGFSKSNDLTLSVHGFEKGKTEVSKEAVVNVVSHA